MADVKCVNHIHEDLVNENVDLILVQQAKSSKETELVRHVQTTPGDKMAGLVHLIFAMRIRFLD